MKFKLFLMGTLIFLFSLFVIALFTRYRQIRTVKNYQECDNSPGKVIIIIGKRTCITMDGRKFEFIPQVASHDVDLTQNLTGSPQVPRVFDSKYHFYAYAISQSPIEIYKQVRRQTYIFADYLLEIYFNTIYTGSK